MAGSVMKGVWGVRLSPSLIYYIVVLVKKDRLCVAKVILAISGTALHIRARKERCRAGEP